MKNSQNNFPETDLSKLIFYFDRRIEPEPMAMQMVTELCGTNETERKEVEEISVRALEMV